MSGDPLHPLFLSKDLVLAIHQAQIQEHGGQGGLRDEGLLESALAQPAWRTAGQYVHQELFEMAAAYLFHIAMNHPFHDGNKRTALASCLVFLEINGYHVRDKGAELADLVLEVIEEHREKEWIAEQLRVRASRA